MHTTKYYDDGRYVGEVNDKGQQDGYGTYYWSETFYFEGWWEKNTPLFGTYVYPDGTEYIGDVKLIKNSITPHGKGTYYYPDGSEYNGEIRDGYQMGKGTMHNIDGSIIEGYFNKQLYYGKCKITYPSGKYFVGDATNSNGNIIHEGKCVSIFGDIYEGKFVNFNLEGHGKHYSKNKRLIYEGEFKNGLYNGKGTYHTTNKIYYEGHFKDNVKNGQGLQRQGINSHAGNFTNGQLDGKGVSIDYHYNTVTEYIWKNGKIIETKKVSPLFKEKIMKTINYKNGDTSKGLPHGYGVFLKTINNEKILYNSEFKKGKPFGFGHIYKENYHYVGEMKKLLKHGQGQEFINNSTIIATYKKDKIHGFASFINYFDNIEVIDGIYKKNKFIGDVKVVYKTGNIYYGPVKGLLGHGKGVYHYDNKIVIAKFNKGVPHGKASMVDNNIYYTCTYNKGKLIEKEKAVREKKNKR